jgi:pyruvate/2-oxoglutarate dehydrogenase complex dihydrolipoamide dehydrogenase (E3) component
MTDERSQSLIAPDDEHDRRLVDNVHPADWRNPEPASRYHLVVVGGGTAGLVSAAGAAGLGAKVALVERHLLGGDCLNVGCVPSKGIIRAARAWHAVVDGKRFGAPSSDNKPGDFAAAMERMRRLRADISPNDGVERFKKLGVDVFLGEGCFTGPDMVEVGGKRLRFRRAVIATGGRAAAPPVDGLEEADYLTNETIFSLTELPKRLLVIGAGPIGCEMAQAFARFGSQVTILDAGERILPREDPDAAAVVMEAMARDGVRYFGNASIERAVAGTGGERTVHFNRDGKPRSLTADEILVAAGRTPNVEGLGLEPAGVAYDAAGVTVDDHLRTSNKKIYACGDVASRYKFTHVADAQARIVIQNALFFGRAKASELVVPWCTYTSPEIAHVGMYEHEAKAASIEVDAITIAMDDVDRAVLDGETEGFLRVLVKKGRDEIVGATLVAAHAGDVIGELALAITAGVGLGKIARTIHPYPTQAEAIKKAADAWRRTKLTPTAKRAFSTYFKLLR